MLSKTHPGSCAGGSRRRKGNRDVSEGMSERSGNTTAGKAGFLTAVSCVLQHRAILRGWSGPRRCSHSSFLQAALLTSRNLVTWTCYVVVLPPDGRRCYQDKLCRGSPAVDVRWCFSDKFKEKANIFLTQLGFHKLSCYHRGERQHHNDSLIIYYIFHIRFISIFLTQMHLSKTSCLMAKHNLEAM